MTALREIRAEQPLRSALSTVGDRWTLLIVLALADAPARFGELADAVGGAAPNVLSARLRSLEGEGLVATSPYSRRPVRLTYELTPTGHELAEVARALAQWEASRRAQPAPFRHGGCEGPLRLAWMCESCGATVPDASSERVTFV